MTKDVFEFIDRRFAFNSATDETAITRDLLAITLDMYAEQRIEKLKKDSRDGDNIIILAALKALTVGYPVNKSETFVNELHRKLDIKFSK